MSKDVLRVRATGKGLVQDYERLETGTNAFIGRKYVELKDQPGRYGFESTDQVVEVPFRVEYVKAIQNGDLEAADQATADRVGVKWDEKKAAARRALAPSSPPPAPTNTTTTSGDAQKGDR